MKKILIVLVSLFILGINASAKEYYVDGSKGNDFFYSGTSDRPYKTIGRAARAVKAGDTVIVREGIYYGPINITAQGTAEKPIVFKAENGAEYKTVITNANQKVRENKSGIWQCIDEDNNIWVTSYTVEKNANVDDDDPAYLFPARVLCDEVDLLGYSSYEGLRDDILEEGTDGYPRGYYYNHSEHKLYVKLDERYGSKNPNDHTIKVAPSIYTYISVSGGWGGGGWCANVMGEDSYNVCIGEYDGEMPEVETAAPSAYVTLEGFTFETPGFAGVFLRSSDVTIRNCWFKGCRTGIRGAARVRFDDKMYSKNILIENCDYSQFPTYDDAYDYVAGQEGQAVKLSWWQRKGVIKDLNYESGGFLNYMGKYWTIRNNYIHDCFDGISYQAMYSYGDDDRGIGAEFIDIYNNKFEKCLDNAIEFEDHGKDIKFHHNYIVSCQDAISWQPLGGTPWPTNIKVYKNVIHNTRDFNEFWSKKGGSMCYAFKVGAALDNWDYGWMTQEKDESGYPLGGVRPEGDGVRIFNNTIVLPGGKLYNSVGKSAMTLYNFMFVNNAICCMPYDKTDKGTAYLLYGAKGFNFSHNAFASDDGQYYSMSDTTLNNGYNLRSFDELGFKELTRLKLNPELKANSSLIGAGVKDRHEPELSSDIGALEYGEIWDK